MYLFERRSDGDKKSKRDEGKRTEKKESFPTTD